MNLAPIVLFVYNRPDHTRTTIEALKNNTLAAQSNLYIYADAPRESGDRDKVNIVRQYIRGVSGFKKVELIERSHNLGLTRSVDLGVTETINRYGKIIVLEDDIKTSPHFLKFMNDGLSCYENNPGVGNICAYLFPLGTQLSENFFLNLFICWGWGTWKNQWETFEQSGVNLLAQIKEESREKAFNIGNSYPYIKMLRNSLAGKNQSWAVRRYASCFLKNQLCLYPRESLVQNIGFDDSGTHGHKVDWFNTPLARNEISVKEMPALESREQFAMFNAYYNSVRIKRIQGRVKKEFKKLFRLN